VRRTTALVHPSRTRRQAKIDARTAAMRAKARSRTDH
jgi:hypothetical protein